MRKTLLILGLIIFAATILRFHDLTRHSLWTDELYTLETSAGHGLEHQRLTNAAIVEQTPDLLTLQNAAPAWAVATTLARDDNHPPLYFLLVRFWRDVFGSSDFALRSLGIVFSVTAVAL